MTWTLIKIVLTAALQVAILTMCIGAFVVLLAAAGYMAVRRRHQSELSDDPEVNTLW